MSSPWPAILISFAAPTLMLMILFHAVARSLGRNLQGWKWFGGLTLLALGVLLLPVRGLPLARWLAGLIDHWSVPALALLAGKVAWDFFGFELLRGEDRRAAWLFGAVIGIALYPLALGVTAFDPYSLGWHFGPLLAGVGIATLVLEWHRNRFGLVLLIALGAWILRVPESGNYWDCLVDPIYFLVSLSVLGVSLWLRARIALAPFSAKEG